MTRTFIDSGVLIAATRLLHLHAALALSLLEEPGRIFLTSPFVHLEVIPKAVFHSSQRELEFYSRYFKIAEWCRDVDKIEALAQTEAATNGLGAMDALHLSAAYLSEADEFVTTEKPFKPIHRSSLVTVRYLFA